MWAGGINVIVGSGTLVTFPTLIALGVPPQVANISNSVGLIAGNVAGSWGYRRELVGQRGVIGQLMLPSLVGSAVGAALFLLLPASAFEAVVPALIVASLILVVLQPRIQRATNRHHTQEQVTSRRWAVYLFAFALSVYGGYFGAAQGIMFMAVYGMLLPMDLQTLNGVKNVVLSAVNICGVLLFLIFAFGKIHWGVAGLIAVGAAIGGLLGAHYGRRISPAALRAVIVVVGSAGLIRWLTA